MDKILTVFSSLIVTIIIYIFISFLVNLSFIKIIKKVNAMKNLVFGLEITLIGIIAFYFKWNYTFNSIFWSIIMWFIPVYLITTGFTLGLIGYLDKGNTAD